jgi:flagellum-specific peptidoglycan hydrolase FlgJ
MIARGRYKKLLKHGNDYKAWAKGLKKLGYATAGHYEQTLVDIIERYHLYTLDEQ